MNCPNCGASYDSKERCCPYCRTPNESLQNSAETAGNLNGINIEIAPRAKGLAANKIMNIILIAEAFILAFIIVGAVMCFLADGTGFGQDREKLEAEFSTLYEERRFGELYSALEESDLFGDEYYEYAQMALLYYDYEQFMTDRMEFFEETREGWLDKYTVSAVIRDINEVLSPYIPAYSGMDGKNAEIWEGYAKDAETFARVVLGFDDNDMEIIKQDYITSEEEDALKKTVIERRAWECLTEKTE